ncbi:MAG: Hpt domain-containing protein [Lachnospiraceae bacterium]|nr:Hpt domain-containing protein [Lachnospiraceae bacterium]
MNYALDLLNEAGLDTKTGLKYTGREDKYLSAIQRFYNNYEKNRAKITESLASENLESLMITVHALKSNSRMIGALSLASMFEDLEHLAKEGDALSVKEKTPAVLSDYSSLIEKLQPVGEMDAVLPEDEISAAEAIETADKLISALDDFDDELSKELVQRLQGYPFRPAMKELLDKAVSYINDYLYDEALKLIPEIKSSIE